MTVLIIREHSRFAVCRTARVRYSGTHALDALLVELSLAGCRLGNVPDGLLTPGKTVSVEIEGSDPFSGIVQWTVDGSIGLKLSKRFHIFELDRLIHLCRGESESSGQTAVRA